MRRLWSHIVLAATSLLMVGGTFASVVTKTKSNIEFSTLGGKELVFRINGKDDDKNIDYNYTFSDRTAVTEIAEIMESRLQTANVTRYKVETQGYDTIKVTFVGDSDREYEIIQNYLTFDATLALSNSKDNVAYADEFLTTGKKAYLEITNGYPQIIIPIDSENERFKAVYEEAKKMAEDGEGEVKEEHDEDEEEGEEHEHQTHAYLYLWYNYVKEYYTYSKMQEDENIKNKVLMTFDSADPFLDDDHTALRAVVAPSDASEGSITPESLKLAYQNARYYVNLLNAESLNYYVTFLFSQRADVLVENLLDHSGEIETVALSRTFIATICAIVVVSLLLIYFYRLGALSIATTSIVATFFGLLFIVLLGAEFNIAGIIGLASLALTSIISGIVYLNKFKEECYRGRSLKKANSEGAKKAVLPIVDLHVVLVALGVACYLLGGAIMKSFAVSAILGGLVSLVLNLAGLRGLMWLVTNEQGLNGRYDLFDISKDQVPNALEEEKQKYYGANPDKDFTKNKKPIAIVSLVLLVASIAGLITFGVMNKGAVYGTTSPYSNSQVYIEYTSDTSDITNLKNDTKAQLDKLLDEAKIGDKKLSSYAEIVEPVSTTMSRDEQTNSGVKTVYYSYYILDFNTQLEQRDSKGEIIEENYVKITYAGVETAANTFFTTDELNTLGFAFNNKVDISLKDTVRVNADQPSFTSLILATSVATAIAAAYLLLRYRLSRGLASLVITVLTVGISAGIFALLHFLPVTSYVSVALPFIALFTFAVGIIYMNKEREMVLEDRSRDNSVENREKIMKRAVAISSTPMTISFIIALYLGVNYFGFMPSNVSWIFLLAILGVSIAIALALTLYGPCAQLFFKWFSKVNIAKPKLNKKKKARPVRVNKSAEPEEAIFIGIND